MQNATISNRLKSYIEKFEEITRLNRVVLQKSRAKQFNSGWNTYYNKGVKNDLVYLYNFSTLYGVYKNIAFSFNIFKESSLELKELLPIEKQTFKVGICTNTEASTKRVQYSREFPLTTSKNIFKTINDLLSVVSIEPQKIFDIVVSSAFLNENEKLDAKNEIQIKIDALKPILKKQSSEHFQQDNILTKAKNDSNNKINKSKKLENLNSLMEKVAKVKAEIKTETDQINLFYKLDELRSKERELYQKYYDSKMLMSELEKKLKDIL